MTTKEMPWATDEQIGKANCPESREPCAICGRPLSLGSKTYVWVTGDMGSVIPLTKIDAMTNQETLTHTGGVHYVGSVCVKKHGLKDYARKELA
jgi:hypothetical protein